MGLIRLKLTDAQACIVELHVLDSAHDDERQPWWPVLEGLALSFDPARAGEVAELFFDASNSEEREPKWSRVAFGLAKKCRKAALKPGS